MSIYHLFFLTQLLCLCYKLAVTNLRNTCITVLLKHQNVKWSCKHFGYSCIHDKVIIHYILTNVWNLTKLAQIHHQDEGKKWLDFGYLDLIFKVTTLEILKKEPKGSLLMKYKVCVHNISLTNGWNLTTLAQIHHKDGAKKWLDFCDLDLISRSLHTKYSKQKESC